MPAPLVTTSVPYLPGNVSPQVVSWSADGQAVIVTRIELHVLVHLAALAIVLVMSLSVSDRRRTGIVRKQSDMLQPIIIGALRLSSVIVLGLSIFASRIIVKLPARSGNH